MLACSSTGWLAESRRRLWFSRPRHPSSLEDFVDPETGVQQLDLWQMTAPQTLTNPPNVWHASIAHSNELLLKFYHRREWLAAGLTLDKEDDDRLGVGGEEVERERIVDEIANDRAITDETKPRGDIAKAIAETEPDEEIPWGQVVPPSKGVARPTVKLPDGHVHRYQGHECHFVQKHILNVCAARAVGCCSSSPSLTHALPAVDLESLVEGVCHHGLASHAIRGRCCVPHSSRSLTTACVSQIL